MAHGPVLREVLPLQSAWGRKSLKSARCIPNAGFSSEAGLRDRGEGDEIWRAWIEIMARESKRL